MRRERVTHIRAEDIKTRMSEVEHAHHAENQRQSCRQHEQPQPDAHSIQKVDREPLNERGHVARTYPATTVTSGLSAATTPSDKKDRRRGPRPTITAKKSPCAGGCSHTAPK